MTETKQPININLLLGYDYYRLDGQILPGERVVGYLVQPFYRMGSFFVKDPNISDIDLLTNHGRKALSDEEVRAKLLSEDESMNVRFLPLHNASGNGELIPRKRAVVVSHRIIYK